MEIFSKSLLVSFLARTTEHFFRITPLMLIMIMIVMCDDYAILSKNIKMYVWFYQIVCIHPVTVLLDPLYHIYYVINKKNTAVCIFYGTSQIARFVWPTWGPPGSWRPQVGPTLAPWILLAGTLYLRCTLLLTGCVLSSCTQPRAQNIHCSTPRVCALWESVNTDGLAW